MNNSITVGMPTERSTEETQKAKISKDIQASNISNDIDPDSDQPTNNDIPERRKIRAFDDPHNLAEEYLERHCQLNGEPTLRHWRDSWFRWKWDRYQEVSHYEIDGEVSNFVRQVFDMVARKYPDNKKLRRPVTQRRISDVLHVLRGLVSVSAGLEPPVRLSRTTPSNRFLVLANGALDYYTDQDP